MKKTRDILAYVPFATATFFAFVVLFPLLEAGIVSAANPETVVARQQVTAELSMTVASTTMVMLPAIPGLTGGTGNASTSVSVITNNTSGYSVTLQADGTVAAMSGDTTSGYFADYASTIPEDWADTSSGQASQFGFGIINESLSSDNGASGYETCATIESCWSGAPTTTAKVIVSVNTNTQEGGDNFSLKFRTHIPANSNPSVPEDWYTATTTITATQL